MFRRPVESTVESGRSDPQGSGPLCACCCRSTGTQRPAGHDR